MMTVYRNPSVEAANASPLLYECACEIRVHANAAPLPFLLDADNFGSDLGFGFDEDSMPLDVASEVQRRLIAQRTSAAIDRLFPIAGVDSGQDCWGCESVRDDDLDDEIEGSLLDSLSGIVAEVSSATNLSGKVDQQRKQWRSISAGEAR